MALSPEALPLRLMAVALDDRPVPPVHAASIDWDFLLDFGQRQEVLPLLLRGAELAGMEIPAPVRMRLTAADGPARACEAAQFVILQRLYAVFESAGIACLPLKGAFLRTLYPSPHLRTMGDIDLLLSPFDPARQRALLTAIDLKPDLPMIRDLTEYDVASDDYSQPPFIFLELHKNLLPKRVNQSVAPDLVAAAALESSVPVEGYRHIRHLCPETHYLYLLAHIHKHYDNGRGVGVRMLADLRVFVKAYGSSLNRYKIMAGLEAMGIETFARELDALRRECFEGEGASSAEMRAAFLEKRLHPEEIGILTETLHKYPGEGRLLTLLRIICISRQRLALYYPALAENAFLYPFYYCKGIWYLLRCRRKHLVELFLFALSGKRRYEDGCGGR
ncbi:MAG: hypothetical protein DELT_01389 [Desulfovibrio sp.]